MGKKGGKGASSSSAGGKGKGQAGPSNANKGGKGGKGGKDDMKNCNYVKARHILCEKYGKIDEAYNELKEKYPGKIPPGKFGEIAKKYSECSSANSGGNLGWFPRGKMVGAFEEKAFNTPPGQVTAPFKSSAGYHIVLVEGRKM
ncbi:Peptidylprolyl isomerase [Gracilaria domingensis]|nr:Peptidylprolyl isomerase [Gracilaria domingensis]